MKSFASEGGEKGYIFKIHEAKVLIVGAALGARALHLEEREKFFVLH